MAALLVSIGAAGLPLAPAPGTHGGSTLAAQESEPAYSTGLHRRLAEAADGFRTGERMFIVIDSVFPYEVTIVTPDSAEAADAWEGRGAPAVLIPVQTEFDDPGVDGPARVFFGCHDPDTRTVPCYVPEYTIEMREIDSVTIAIHGRDTTIAQTVGPVDAVFIGLSAMDKFAIPYLTRLYGVGFADSVRRAVVDTVATTRVSPPRRD